MTVQEMALRNEVRQMLCEAGYNRKTLREEAKKTIREVFSNYFTFDGEEEADKIIGVLEQAKTNGDMIREMFPHYNIEIDENKGYVYVFYDDFYTTYPLKWWNEPYKK